MTALRGRTDDELLVATPRDADAFAEFYRRHAAPLAGYFLRRVRSPEAAADLTAETFAQALREVRRFDPQRGVAAAWLYGIARRKLIDSIERGRVEDRARRRLGMERIALDDESLERVVETASATAVNRRIEEILSGLPEEQRDALEARVVEERAYAEIASDARTTSAAVRQRVSRALTTLRDRVKEDAAP